MKILIIRNALKQDFGGAERLAVHLALELTSLIHDATILSSQPRLRQYAKTNNVDIRGCLWWSRQNWSGKNIILTPIYFLWQIFLTTWYVFRISAIRPDALHIMSKDDFIAATLAGKLLRKSVVWTDCADLKHIYRNNDIWYKNPIGKLIFHLSKNVNAVTMVSKSEKNLIEQSLTHSTPTNYRVVHLASREQKVVEIERKSGEKDQIIFCATSRLVTDKGITELISAFQMLRNENNRFKLYLVGDGPERQKFEELAAQDSNIIFIGHTNEPLRYVKMADIFVHPTYHEGFSLSLAEAAMLGKPMIATNVGGNPELVNDQNGILIPVRDAVHLAEAMTKLGTHDTLRQQLGTQARKDYRTKIEFSKLVKEEVVPLYEKSK